MDLLSAGLIVGSIWVIKELGNYIVNPFGYKYKWRKIAESLKLDNYNVIDISKQENSVELTIDLPPGGTLESIEKNKGAIEKHFKCICKIEDIRFSSLAKIVLMLSAVSQFKFEPVKCLDNRLYIGRDFVENNFFINLLVDPHVLICGKTGTGKSFLLAIILTNLMYWNKNIDIYLNQTAKREVDYAKNCKQVKFTAYNPIESLVILKRAYQYIQERSKLFSNCGARDIDHFNKLYPNRKLKRKFYIFEEVSCYMPNDRDSEEESIIKSQCWSLMWDIVKLGRAVGVHFIGVTQRATAKNLGGDGEIKSQLCICSFRMRSELDSRNAIDTNTAAKLENQEVVVSGNDGETIVKTPYVDKEFTILQKYIPEIIVPVMKESKVIRKEVEEVHFTHTPIIDHKAYSKVYINKDLLAIDTEKNPIIVKRGLYKC